MLIAGDSPAEWSEKSLLRDRITRWRGIRILLRPTGKRVYRVFPIYCQCIYTYNATTSGQRILNALLGGNMASWREMTSQGKLERIERR
jgi:hypothetical protein